MVLDPDDVVGAAHRAGGRPDAHRPGDRHRHRGIGSDGTLDFHSVPQSQVNPLAGNGCGNDRRLTWIVSFMTSAHLRETEVKEMTAARSNNDHVFYRSPKKFYPTA